MFRPLGADGQGMRLPLVALLLPICLLALAASAFGGTKGSQTLRVTVAGHHTTTRSTARLPADATISLLRVTVNGKPLAETTRTNWTAFFDGVQVSVSYHTTAKSGPGRWRIANFGVRPARVVVTVATAGP